MKPIFPILVITCFFIISNVPEIDIIHDNIAHAGPKLPPKKIKARKVKTKKSSSGLNFKKKLKPKGKMSAGKLSPRFNTDVNPTKIPRKKSGGGDKTNLRPKSSASSNFKLGKSSLKPHFNTIANPTTVSPKKPVAGGKASLRPKNFQKHNLRNSAGRSNLKKHFNSAANSSPKKNDGRVKTDKSTSRLELKGPTFQPPGI